LAIAARLVPLELTNDRAARSAAATASKQAAAATLFPDRSRSFEASHDVKSAIEAARKPLAGTEQNPEAEGHEAPPRRENVPSAEQPPGRQPDLPPEKSTPDGIRPGEALPPEAASAAPLHLAAAGERVAPSREPVPAEPAARPERPEPPAPNEGTKMPAPVRNIRLDMASGEQRVEVRMVERSGNVHLVVRTPDERLSGALRENLQDLSTRLEQTGFRAESWHTAGESKRDLLPTGAPADLNSESQSGGRRQQDHPDPRQPNDFEDQPKRKEKGKEFAWFMASLRG
jgi:hypothetical protein